MSIGVPSGGKGNPHRARCGLLHLFTVATSILSPTFSLRFLAMYFGQLHDASGQTHHHFRVKR
jgi:hypothetical protein